MITTITRYVKSAVIPTVLVPLSSACSKVMNTPTGTRNTALFTGVAAIGITAGYLACKWTNDEKLNRIADKVLNGESGLATDYLEEGYGLDDSFEFDNPLPDAPSGPATTQRGVARLDHSRVEVSQHRRIRPNKQMKYLNCIMAEIKNKFGTPMTTEANRKAIMRFANGIMTKHGLRPTHIKQYLPMLVDLAFVPSQDELNAVRMMTSSACSSAKIQYVVNGCLGGFSQSC